MFHFLEIAGSESPKWEPQAIVKGGWSICQLFAIQRIFLSFFLIQESKVSWLGFIISLRTPGIMWKFFYIQIFFRGKTTSIISTANLLPPPWLSIENNRTGICLVPKGSHILLWFLFEYPSYLLVSLLFNMNPTWPMSSMPIFQSTQSIAWHTVSTWSM